MKGNSHKNDEQETSSFSEFKDVVDSYKKTETWQQGRQVLSVLASRMSFKDVLSLLPEVTPHLYYAARSHAKIIGAALPVPERVIFRQRIDPQKLDVFLDYITSSNVVRDLPYGEKKLKLSDGTVQNMPNIVRCMGSADIIAQFKAYCKENDLTPLGDSTMYRILSECGAKVRTSLEGLDYFVAEGGRAFVTLQNVLDKLFQYEVITLGTYKDYQALLFQSKQYLRTDFKIHLSMESEVPDHCIPHALSDTKDPAFAKKCKHTHNMVCESCEQLKEMMKSFEKIFLTATVDEKEDEMNDLQFRVQQSIKSIVALKKHIIRCKNQDLAKAHLFDYMPTNEVLLVCDWAMKYLPRKFREDQCDWFAKRGIPWHICMAFCRRDDGSIGSLGFAHLFANQISQDSQVTASIIKDVMKHVKDVTEQDDVKFHLWSDNAGCYKSTEMLSQLFHSGLVKSFNFCESQNGKGPCDRTAATIKSGIKRYVNQGHDVLTAHAMKEAIDKSTKNVKFQVYVVEDYLSKKSSCRAIPSITSYSNFTFSPNGITAWRAYQIGEGKLIPSSTITVNTELNPVQLVNPAEVIPNFHSLLNKKESQEDVFTCTNEGCSQTFATSQHLSNHLMFGKCNYQFHCQSSNGCDITKKLYMEKMSKSFAKNFSISSDGQVEVGSNLETMLEQGWALKDDRRNKRFNENQKSFLKEKFDVGLRTGRKEDPYIVAEEMLTVKNIDGQRRFSYDEILTVTQVTSFFSRMNRKSNTVDATREKTIQQIRQDLIED